MKYFGIFSVILLIFATACTNENWSKTEQDEFLSICFDEGGSKSYCHCFLEEMMNHTPIAEEVDQINFEEKVEIAKNCD